MGIHTISLTEGDTDEHMAGYVKTYDSRKEGKDMLSDSELARVEGSTEGEKLQQTHNTGIVTGSITTRESVKKGYTVTCDPSPDHVEFQLQLQNGGMGRVLAETVMRPILGSGPLQPPEKLEHAVNSSLSDIIDVGSVQKSQQRLNESFETKGGSDTLPHPSVATVTTQPRDKDKILYNIFAHRRFVESRNEESQ